MHDNSHLPPVVLLYHNLLPPGANPTHDPQSIPLNTLFDHIASLEAAGFENVDLAEAFALATGAVANEPARRTFALTFDDAYENLHAFLPPILRRARASVFVITGQVGRSTLEWNTKAPVVHRHMDVDQIGDLADQGATIESHGPDHHNMLKFGPRDLASRLEDSQEWFRRHLDFAPSYLAYPYGACSEETQAIAAGYFAGALSVSHGLWSGPGCRFALNRISVPFFLTGNDLVDVVATEPNRRWAEIERRAPWRRDSR